MSTKKSEESKRTTERFLYLGIGDNGKDHNYVHLTEKVNPNLGLHEVANKDHWQWRVFKKKLCNCEPGTIFEIEAERRGDEGLTVFGKGKAVSQWGVLEEARTWRATNNAILSAKRTSRELKTDWLEALGPIRRSYQRLNTLQRSALLVRVMNYIQGGRK